MELSRHEHTIAPHTVASGVHKRSSMQHSTYASSMALLMLSPLNHLGTNTGQLLCCCKARCSSAFATRNCAGR